jgi:hypothetical protein
VRLEAAGMLAGTGSRKVRIVAPYELVARRLLGERHPALMVRRPTPAPLVYRTRSAVVVVSCALLGMLMTSEGCLLAFFLPSATLPLS